MLNRYGNVAVVLCATENGGTAGRVEAGTNQMTNHETELEVQACLDRELSGGAMRTVEDLLSRDVEARALFEELRTTKSLVAENELEQKLPESREFFWSGIERRIKADEGLRRTAEVSEGRATSWLRFLAPAGALGALAIFVGMALWT